MLGFPAGHGMVHYRDIDIFHRSGRKEVGRRWHRGLDEQERRDLGVRYVQSLHGIWTIDSVVGST